MPKKPANEIPDWFNLKNYWDETDLNEFAYQIYVRRCVNGGSWIVKPEHVKSGKAAEFYRRSMTGGFDLRDSFELKKETEQVKLRNIKPISEARHGGKYAGILSGNFLFNEQHDDIPTHAKIIHVDLNFTDEKIKKDFSLYLKRRRKEEDSLKNIRNDTITAITGWKHLNLLATYDLLFWRSATGNSITLQALANELNCNQGEGRLRQTLIPILKEMMQEGIVEILLASEI